MIPFATRDKILFGYTTYYNDPYLFENFIDISVGRKINTLMVIIRRHLNAMEKIK